MTEWTLSCALSAMSLKAHHCLPCSVTGAVWDVPGSAIHDVLLDSRHDGGPSYRGARKKQRPGSPHPQTVALCLVPGFLCWPWWTQYFRSLSTKAKCYPASLGASSFPGSFNNYSLLPRLKRKQCCVLLDFHILVRVCRFRCGFSTFQNKVCPL